jgi:hypothetical protein
MSSNKKIAFLFLTRDNVNHPKLWEQYFKGNKKKINIYCHPKNPVSVSVSWQKKNIISNIVETGWGFITNAYYELLKEAYKNQHNMKFIVISESCIPIVPFNEMHDKIMKNDDESFIKFMDLDKSGYDYNERIKTQKNYENYSFCKHYARFCLSRCHVAKLLEKHVDFTNFFNKMHVGDEFFLTLLKPNAKERDKCKITNQEITFDNWDYVKKQVNQINNEIKLIYEKYERINTKRFKKTMTKNVKKFKGGNRNNIKKKTLKHASITKIVLLSSSDINTIKQLKIKKEDIGKNPKTYFNLSKNDIDEALKKKSFFMRKIDKSTDVSLVKKIL